MKKNNEIKINLSALQNSIAEFKQLELNIQGRAENKQPFQISRGGSQIQTIYTLAETRKCRDEIDLVLENSILFFEAIKNSYEESDKEAAAAIFE